MAIYLQTHKTFFVLSISTSFLFLLLINKVNSLDTVSFSFKKFVPGQPELLFQGDAHATSTGHLQLTNVDEGGKPVSNSLGRALYSTPIQIWDSDTGHVATFETVFQFVINAPNTDKTAEGLAFFLAPVDTQPQKPGGFLGLFNSSDVDKSSQTVAVEFDNLYNEEWDAEAPHIGIDVNSIKSTNTTSWGFKNGQLANVAIVYDASIKTLRVSLDYPPIDGSYTVDAVVDLKEVLPEWVRVGFSATTGLVGEYVETHDVLSWFFLTLDNQDSSTEDFKNKAHLSSYVSRHQSI